jgi:SpoVK/Ycf46/Vps4 family AAA+-type ATPase
MGTPMYNLSGMFGGNALKQEVKDEAVAVKSVRQGKLDRKEGVDTSKRNVKKKKQEDLQALQDKKDNLNIDKIEATGQPTNYDDSSSKKQIRLEKRRSMQDIRDKEKGARRTDKRNRGIERAQNKYNITPEQASEYYDKRQQTYSAYNKANRNMQDSDALQGQEEQSGDDIGEQIIGSMTEGTKNIGAGMDTNSASKSNEDNKGNFTSYM